MKGGERSARVLLAGAASSLLTLVVAAPMAYQAHAARDAGEQHQAPAEDRTTPTVNPTVLGTSSVPPTSTTVAPTTSAAPDVPPSSAPTTAAPGSSSPTTRPGAGSGSGAGGPDPSPGANAETPTAPTTSLPWFVAPAPPTTVPDPPVTPPAPPTTTPPPTAPVPSPDGLRWSSLAPRSPGNLLHGAHLEGPTFVFLDLDDVARVTFSLDGVVTADELQLPWELFGGLPLVPALLPAGSHTVQAVVVLTDGSTTVRAATFTTGAIG